VKRPAFIFFVLVIYVLSQFAWWAYLLIALNDEVYNHRIENLSLMNLTPEQRKSEVVFFEQKISNRRWMVIGEGGVFLALLVWGTIMMVIAYRKEILLAKQQKNFLLSITHEFKSPLAAIKLYMQTLLRHDLDKDREHSFINSAISDTDRLNNLVENALLANLIDHKGYSFSKEEVNFSAYIRLMVQKFQQMPDHENVISHIEEGNFIYADKNALNILIYNLLENAWKYSHDDKKITVDVSGNNKNIILEIGDQGIGIPDKEKAKIFDKFYRVGNEETRRTKGTGLGLFICKYIVSHHDGKIQIRDNTPTGTIVRLEFPAVQND
jgi:two-component system phosphate regulon sensor histidine kinase PhoR